MTYIQNIWGNANSSYISKIKNKLEVEKNSNPEIEKLKKRVTQLEKQIRFFSYRPAVTGLVLTQLAELPRRSCRHIFNPYQPSVANQIEDSSALNASHIINNSYVCYETEVDSDSERKLDGSSEPINISEQNKTPLKMTYKSIFTVATNPFLRKSLFNC